jgi:hypothetical protein
MDRLNRLPIAPENRTNSQVIQPSHIDDWMYAKLAGVKSNVNENRVKIAYSGGFSCEMLPPDSQMALGRGGRQAGRALAESGWLHLAGLILLSFIRPISSG